jgi:Ca2+-transporting ATPase
MRRDPESGLLPPVLGALKILSIPIVVTVFAVQAGVLQDLLMTTSLTGGQWLACIGWSLIIPVAVEAEKAVRRRRHLISAPPPPIRAPEAVDPRRARPS